MTRKTLGYVELEWTCPNCGNKNPGTQRTCQTCGSPQPTDVSFEQGERQELITDAAKIEAAKAGPDIHCGFCGARNPAGTTICKQCGADLKHGSKRVSGQVVGAFKTGPATQVPCPSCGALNPDTAHICSQCGASLRRPKAEAEPGAVPAKASALPIKGGVGVAVIAGVVILAILACIIMFLAGRTKANNGVVQTVNWQRSIAIEAIGPVTHEDWKDQIPADGAIGNCSQQERSVESAPVPNSTEVCGTPFTVDSGSGAGQVVQDCEYHVYDDYCQYTIQEWTRVDEAVLQGSDLNPVWPNPNLSSGERLGEQKESYTIIFNVGGKTYTYEANDPALFSQAQIGSQWVLHINTFGSVTAIEPAR